MDVNKIVIASRIEHGDNIFKHFIGFADGDSVRPLCIKLPQMSEFIKYFDNGGKYMSFMIKDDSLLAK